MSQDNNNKGTKLGNFMPGNKIIKRSSLDNISENAESTKFVSSKSKRNQRFVPKIDYSNPEEFAKFGSAESYYTDSIERVYKTYPYDGSLHEQEEWLISSSFLDLYVFNNLYPKVVGSFNFSANGWGNLVGSKSGNYGKSDDAEYITVFGGPTTGDIYSQTYNRDSSLKFDPINGNTIELWINKSEFVSSSKTDREVIFDCYSKNSTSTETKARITLELDTGATGSDNCLMITYMSGAMVNNSATLKGINQLVQGSDQSKIVDGNWHHLALSLYNVGDDLRYDFYLDGTRESTETISNQALGISNRNMIATIGALATSDVVNSNGEEGSGHLLASIDEFRFWKSMRNEKQIGRYFQQEVNGGTDSDHTNSSLGVYFKFNEGTNLTQPIVLDYSGRAKNGTITNYKQEMRSSESAINSSPFTEMSEKPDPIIFPTDELVSNLLARMQQKGLSHDLENSSLLKNTTPSFMLEEDHGNHLNNLVQTISSYFDEADAYISHLPQIKQIRYEDILNVDTSNTSSTDCFDGNNVTTTRRSAQYHDPTTVALISQFHDGKEIFANAEVIEQFLGRTEGSVRFESSLYDIRDFIVQNIYNNLTHIYKKKGTEQSFRNLIRCFGVDDELIKLNVYSNNGEFKINDDSHYTTYRAKTLSMSHEDNREISLCQVISSENPGISKNFIPAPPPPNTPSATADARFGLTAEANIVFPMILDKSHPNYSRLGFTESCLFGFGQSDRTATVAHKSLYVAVVKDSEDSPDARFQLFEPGNNTPILTSELIPDVYSNSTWNISLRVRNPVEHLHGIISGTASKPYEIVLSGYNYSLDELQNSFSVSTNNYTFRDEFIQNDKEFFLGARRANVYNGNVETKTDVRFINCTLWQDALDDEELMVHAKNPSNIGRINSFKNIDVHTTSLDDFDIKREDTKILHWDFNNTQESSGEIKVDDLSHGSSQRIANNGAMGAIVGFDYPAITVGVGNLEKSIKQDFIVITKFSTIENVHASDQIQILDADRENFNTSSRPETFSFSFEKSMSATISDEIIKYFGSLSEFNNLIGEPVHKYRHGYKGLEKLRAKFFDKVSNEIDYDRFITFFRWIDESLSKFLNQLKPYSSQFTGDLSNVVESHILERNKYDHKFPTLEMKLDDPESPMLGVNELLYDWEHGHAPRNPTAATASIVFNNVPSPGDQITLTSSLGTIRTYTAAQTSSFAANEFQRTPTHAAGNALVSAINNPFGHAGEIIASYDSATRTLSLTQQETGKSGNTTIQSDLQNVTVPDKFTGGSDLGLDESQNCLWWADRAEGNKEFTYANDIGDTREYLRQMQNKQAKGSTYVFRKLSRPYKYSVDNQPIYKGGQYRDSYKIDDYYKVVTQFASVSKIQLLKTDIAPETSCQDVLNPQNKTEITGQTTVTGLGGYYNVDSDLSFPFTMISSSAADMFPSIHSNILITNNHLDQYGDDYEIPLQSPFTERFVGGMPHRHQDMNRDATQDLSAKRPEAYNLVENANTSITLEARTPLQAASRYYRDGLTKRPVNIANIKFTKDSKFIGNYNKDYEVVMVNGRSLNNNDFVDNEGYNLQNLQSQHIAGLVEPELPINKTSIVDSSKKMRTRTEHVIVNRFSSPGGPETSLDSVSTDFESSEFSPYNTINYRNLNVRRILDSLHSEKSNQFGLRPVVSAGGHEMASLHMTNRNPIADFGISGTTTFNNKAILFDGSNHYLQIDNTTPIFRNQNSFSIFAWIKHPAVTNPHHHNIFAVNTSGGGNRILFGIKGTTDADGVTDGQLFVYTDDTSKHYKGSSLRVDDDKWHLVGITYRAADHRVFFYVDGALQGSQRVGKMNELFPDNCKISIGQEWDNASTSGFFKGYIAEYAAWNTILTDGQVKEVYSDGAFLGPRDLNLLSTKSNLQVWYRMGEGSSGTLSDRLTGNAPPLIRRIYDMSTNLPKFDATPEGFANETALKDRSSDTSVAKLPGLQWTTNMTVDHDNFLVNHPIPQNDVQYSWITKSSDETIFTFPGYMSNFTTPREFAGSTFPDQIEFIGDADNKDNTKKLDFVDSNRVVQDKEIDITANVYSYKLDQSGSMLADAKDLNERVITRQGPYGHPSWKQIRGYQNPITRQLKKQNIYSYSFRSGVHSPNAETNSYEMTLRNAFSAKRRASREVRNYKEIPVTTRFNPLFLADFDDSELRDVVKIFESSRGTAPQNYEEMFWTQTGLDKIPPSGSDLSNQLFFVMKDSYANEITSYSNMAIAEALGIEEKKLTSFDSVLEQFSKLENAPPTFFRQLSYIETIYPKEVCSFKKEVRLRENFSFNYKDTHDKRIDILSGSNQYSNYNDNPGALSDNQKRFNNPEFKKITIDKANTVEVNSMFVDSVDYFVDSSSNESFQYISQSLWPLDSRKNISTTLPTCMTMSFVGAKNSDFKAGGRDQGTRFEGELQNDYSIYHMGINLLHGMPPAGVVYNRRVPQEFSADNAGANTGEYLTGEAKWQVPEQSGVHPLDNNYEEFNKDLGLIGRDYSLVPEFRISEHVGKVVNQNLGRLTKQKFSEPLENMITLNGAVSNQNPESPYDLSVAGEFYKTYATSDFLKYFSVLDDSFEEKGISVSPNRISLKCSAVMKFLPYEGFYPVERTKQIASIFAKDYMSDFSYVQTDGIPIDNSLDKKISGSLGQVIKPLFAPGVLYNSIKSGVAVDYPIFENKGKNNPAAMVIFVNLHDEEYDTVPWYASTEPPRGDTVTYASRAEPILRLKDSAWKAALDIEKLDDAGNPIPYVLPNGGASNINLGTISDAAAVPPYKQEMDTQPGRTNSVVSVALTEGWRESQDAQSNPSVMATSYNRQWPIMAATADLPANYPTELEYPEEGYVGGKGAYYSNVGHRFPLTKIDPNNQVNSSLDEANYFTIDRAGINLPKMAQEFFVISKIYTSQELPTVANPGRLRTVQMQVGDAVYPGFSVKMLNQDSTTTKFNYRFIPSRAMPGGTPGFGFVGNSSALDYNFWQRELFGNVGLTADGSPTLDANGKPLPPASGIENDRAFIEGVDEEYFKNVWVPVDAGALKIVRFDREHPRYNYLVLQFKFQSMMRMWTISLVTGLDSYDFFEDPLSYRIAEKAPLFYKLPNGSTKRVVPRPFTEREKFILKQRVSSNNPNNANTCMTIALGLVSDPTISFRDQFRISLGLDRETGILTGASFYFITALLYIGFLLLLEGSEQEGEDLSDPLVWLLMKAGLYPVIPGGAGLMMGKRGDEEAYSQVDNSLSGWYVGMQQNYFGSGGNQEIVELNGSIAGIDPRLGGMTANTDMQEMYRMNEFEPEARTLIFSRDSAAYQEATEDGDYLNYITSEYSGMSGGTGESTATSDRLRRVVNNMSSSQEIIEFGSITSGIGITGSFVNGTSDNWIPRIKSKVSTRVNFDNILDPNSLFGTILYDNEPHPSATIFYGNYENFKTFDYPAHFGNVNLEHSAGSLGVVGFALNNNYTSYKLAINNFVSETVNFFLEDRRLTTLESGEVDFVGDGKLLKMRVYIKNKNTVVYDRKSAFGPPVNAGVFEREVRTQELQQVGNPGVKATGFVEFLPTMQSPPVTNSDMANSPEAEHDNLPFVRIKDPTGNPIAIRYYDPENFYNTTPATASLTFGATNSLTTSANTVSTAGITSESGLHGFSITDTVIDSDGLATAIGPNNLAIKYYDSNNFVGPTLSHTRSTSTSAAATASFTLLNAGAAVNSSNNPSELHSFILEDTSANEMQISYYDPVDYLTDVLVATDVVQGTTGSAGQLGTIGTINPATEEVHPATFLTFKSHATITSTQDNIGGYCFPARGVSLASDSCKAGTGPGSGVNLGLPGFTFSKGSDHISISYYDSDHFETTTSTSTTTVGGQNATAGFIRLTVDLTDLSSGGSGWQNTINVSGSDIGPILRVPTPSGTDFEIVFFNGKNSFDASNPPSGYIGHSGSLGDFVFANSSNPKRMAVDVLDGSSFATNNELAQRIVNALNNFQANPFSVQRKNGNQVDITQNVKGAISNPALTEVQSGATDPGSNPANERYFIFNRGTAGSAGHIFDDSLGSVFTGDANAVSGGTATSTTLKDYKNRTITSAPDLPPPLTSAQGNVNYIDIKDMTADEIAEATAAAFNLDTDSGDIPLHAKATTGGTMVIEYTGGGNLADNQWQITDRTNSNHYGAPPFFGVLVFQTGDIGVGSSPITSFTSHTPAQGATLSGASVGQLGTTGTLATIESHQRIELSETAPRSSADHAMINAREELFSNTGANLTGITNINGTSTSSGVLKLAGQAQPSAISDDPTFSIHAVTDQQRTDINTYFGTSASKWGGFKLQNTVQTPIVVEFEHISPSSNNTTAGDNPSSFGITDKPESIFAGGGGSTGQINHLWAQWSTDGTNWNTGLEIYNPLTNLWTKTGFAVNSDLGVNDGTDIHIRFLSNAQLNADFWGIRNLVVSKTNADKSDNDLATETRGAVSGNSTLGITPSGSNAEVTLTQDTVGVGGETTIPHPGLGLQPIVSSVAPAAFSGGTGTPTTINTTRNELLSSIPTDSDNTKHIDVRKQFLLEDFQGSTSIPATLGFVGTTSSHRCRIITHASNGQNILAFDSNRIGRSNNHGIPDLPTYSLLATDAENDDMINFPNNQRISGTKLANSFQGPLVVKFDFAHNGGSLLNGASTFGAGTDHPETFLSNRGTGSQQAFGGHRGTIGGGGAHHDGFFVQWSTDGNIWTTGIELAPKEEYSDSWTTGGFKVDSTDTAIQIRFIAISNSSTQGNEMWAINNLLVSDANDLKTGAEMASSTELVADSFYANHSNSITSAVGSSANTHVLTMTQTGKGPVGNINISELGAGIVPLVQETTAEMTFSGGSKTLVTPTARSGNLEAFVSVRDNAGSLDVAANMVEKTKTAITSLESKYTFSGTSPRLTIIQTDAGTAGNESANNGKLDGLHSSGDGAWSNIFNNVTGHFTFSGGTDSTLEDVTYFYKVSKENVTGSGHAPYVPPFLDPDAAPYIEFSITPEQGKRYSWSDVIRELDTNYVNFKLPYSNSLDDEENTNENYKYAMNLDASLDWISSYVIPETSLEYSEANSDTIVHIARPTDERYKRRWVIQTKWETPILDFSGIEMEASYMENGSQVSTTTTESPWEPERWNNFLTSTVNIDPKEYLASSRGMWHQYGSEPLEQKGYYLQITDSPDENAGSLADVVGFKSTDETVKEEKIGKIAAKREVSEAVVAIPYYTDSADNIKFFVLDRAKIFAGADENKKIQRELLRPPTSSERNKTKEEVKEMRLIKYNNLYSQPNNPVAYQMRMMERYVFPPQFDFITFPEKIDNEEAIAMYVFEFKAELTKQDLINVWQNTRPTSNKSAASPQHSSVTGERPGNIIDTEYVSHELGATRSSLLTNEFFTEKVRWLIFKVKRRAESDYSKVKINSAFETLENEEFIPQNWKENLSTFRRDRNLRDIHYSYNWPYDFFSLVELIKVESKVDFKLKDSGIS